MGIVEYSQPALNQPLVEPTVNAIRQKLAGQYELKVLQVPREILEQDVKSGKVNIFLSSAGFYRRLIHDGARDLATASSLQYPDPNRSDGAAIVVLAKRNDLKDLSDLKGKKLAVTSTKAFSGYHIPLGEIAQLGYDPLHFFGHVREVGGLLPEKTLPLLERGEADVVFLRQCALEKYLEQHKEKAKLFRVLGAKQTEGQCARSTDLYPTWTLASTKSASPEVSRLVTAAVLDMPKTEGEFYWGVSTDYSAVDRLYQTLKIGPYRYLRDWTLKRFWDQCWPFLMLALCAFIGLIWHSRRTDHLVHVRTRQLHASLQEKNHLRKVADEAKDRLVALEKLAIVQQLCSIFVHEMRQPLGTIALYLEGLKTMIPEDRSDLMEILDRLEGQNRRADAIVERVRSYYKHKPQRNLKIDLCKVVSRAVETLKRSKPEIQSRLKANCAKPVYVLGDELELELLAINLIKNALEAIEKDPKGLVQVTVENETLCVIDNGTVSTDTELEDLRGNPVSTKKGGLGLGLSIVRAIAEKHGAEIRFSVSDPHGLKVLVKFPHYAESLADN